MAANIQTKALLLSDIRCSIYRENKKFDSEGNGRLLELPGSEFIAYVP
jgi:hypothetical protein